MMDDFIPYRDLILIEDPLSFTGYSFVGKDSDSQGVPASIFEISFFERMKEVEEENEELKKKLGAARVRIEYLRQKLVASISGDKEVE